MKMDPVVHFEMPATDKKRMMDFYARVFNWQMKMLGSDMGEYVVVTTTDTDETNGRPKTPGAINGGFYQRTDDPIDQYPSVVIAVDNIEESIKEVEAASGKIHGSVEDIPGVGLYVSIIDTEGNHVRLLQPKM